MDDPMSSEEYENLRKPFLKDDEKSPFVVNPAGIFGAIIQEGIYKGLPHGLAQCISRGVITFEEVKQRGWKYGDKDFAA